VYSTLPRGVVDLHGAAAITNALLHYVAPLLAVIGWLLLVPRPRITENTLVGVGALFMWLDHRRPAAPSAVSVTARP
jgi:hypothetical protein